MVESTIKDKILQHLEGLNELEHKKGEDEMIQVIAERYDTDEETVRQVLAEWSAGRMKVE